MGKKKTEKNKEELEKEIDNKKPETTDTKETEQEVDNKEFKNLRIELEDEELKEGESREEIIAEENMDVDAKKIKMRFFKRFMISIKDFDRYIEIAMQKLSNSFGYLFILILLCSIIFGTVMTTKSVKDFKENPDKIREQVIKTQETYNIQTDMAQVDKMLNETTEGGLIVILIIPMILALIVVLSISTLLNVLIISILGYLLSRFMRIPLKFRATFNMAASAVTLPIILNVIYSIVNTYTGFTINYFDLMYNLIAYVYMLVAIIFIRAEIIKKDIEGEEAK